MPEEAERIKIQGKQQYTVIGREFGNQDILHNTIPIPSILRIMNDFYFEHLLFCKQNHPNFHHK